MSKRAKGYACRQPDFHRVPKVRTRRPRKPAAQASDDGTGFILASLLVAIIAFAGTIIVLGFFF
jgi:hypothetical protein